MDDFGRKYSIVNLSKNMNAFFNFSGFINYFLWRKFNFSQIGLTNIVVAVFILVSQFSHAQVTLPHYEPLNYTVGQGLQIQSGWTSLNTGDDLLMTSGNLSYLGLNPSSGNKVTFEGAGIDAAKLFTQQTSGTVYFSFLLDVTSLGSLNTTGSYFTSFNEGTGTNYGASVWLRSDGAGYDIGVNPRTTAGNTVWSSGTTSVNSTLLIVISYQIIAGTSNDVVNLWINPIPGGVQPSATLTSTNTGTDLANVNRILLRQSTATTTPFVEMDEFRIGSTWASVTPGTGVVTTIASGFWTNPAIWSSGVVPGASDDVLINHFVTSGARTRNPGTTTTIGTAGELSIIGLYTCVGATNLVNGYFQIDVGGSVLGDNFIYGPNSTLEFHHPSYTVLNTEPAWPIANGPRHVSVIGGVIMSSTNRTVLGNYYLNGTTTLTSSVLTLSGTCIIYSGSFNQSPTFSGAGSTLMYSTSSAYTNGNEWNGGGNTNPIVGLGVPGNVILQSNSTSVILSGARGVPGNITVAANTVLTLNAVANNDLFLGGDLTLTGSAGGLVHNNRSVHFVQSAAQQHLFAQLNPLHSIVVNKPSGELVCDAPTVIAANSGNAIQLLSGNINLNSQSIEFSNSGANILVHNGTRNIYGGGYIYIVLGISVSFTGTLPALVFANDVDVDLLSSGTTNFGSNTTINGKLYIYSNTSFIAAGGAPYYGIGSSLKYATYGTYLRGPEWSSTTPGAKGYPHNVSLSGNGTVLVVGGNGGTATPWEAGGDLTIASNTSFSMNSAGYLMTAPVKIHGNVTFDGTLYLSSVVGGDLKVGGDFSKTTNGGLAYNNGKVIFFKNGTQTVSAVAGLSIGAIQVGEGASATTVQLNNSIYIHTYTALGGLGIHFNNSSSIIDINGNLLSIGDGTGTEPCYVTGAGFLKGSSTSKLTLLSAGGLMGTISFLSGFQTLQDFTINRESNVYGVQLGSNLTVSGNLTLTNGIIGTGDYVLAIGSAGVVNSASTNSFIATNGIGELRYYLASSGTYSFPVGDIDGPNGNQYSRAAITLTGGNPYVTNYLAVSVFDIKHPDNEAPTDFLTRYWRVKSGGFIAPPSAFSGQFFYTTPDISGSEFNLDPYRWNGTIWSAGGIVNGLSNYFTSDQFTVNLVNEYTAGFPVTLQEINVKQGSTNYLNGSTYNFGTVTPSTNSDVVFTIQNIGFGNLNLGAATISGTGFSLLSPYSSPIVGPSNSSNFTIRFSPSTSIAYSGNISIPNDDPDGGENPYVIYFTGQGSGNNQSDITYNSSSTASQNQNLPYVNYQSAVISNTGSGAGGSIGVMGLTIRDGGASNDADNFDTELTAISFTATNWINIRSARLFNGNSPIGTTVSVTGSTITFSGLTGVICGDNSTLALNLRITFNTSVTDNQKMVFTITSATAGPNSTSSTFAASDAGGAISDNNNANDINRIEVLADRIAFNQQPSNTAINVGMIPSVTVRGKDILGNNDLDYTGSIQITSSGTLVGTPVTQAAVNGSGIATFVSLIHSVAENSRELTATTTGLTVNSIISNTFHITTEPNGSYRTIGSGNWNNNSPSPAIWEQLISGVWTSSNSPSYSTSNNVYIRNGNTIATNGSFGNSVYMFVQNGGTFNVNHPSTCRDLTVNSGGVVTANADLKIAGSGVLTVENEATLILNYDYSSPNASIWNGTENFHPTSNLEIWWASSGVELINSAITTNTYNTYTAALGNVYVDFASGSAYRGNSTFGSHYVIVASSMNNRNICHGDFEIASAAGYNYRITSGATVSTGIGGDLIISSGMGSARELLLSTSSGTLTLTVNGDVVLDCAGDLSLNGGTTGSTILNVEGDILMNQPNTTSNTELRFHTTIYTPTIVSSVLNLKGNLFSINGALSSAASPITAASGSSPAVLAAEINFIGNSTQQVQIVNPIGVNTTDRKGIALKVKNGASVLLNTYDLQLNQNSSIIIEDLGTLDFGFNGLTALLVTQPISSGGSNWFKSDQGSTLKITSPDGITTTASIGNVQVSASNRSFNNTSRFWYIGKGNQLTGNALTVGSTGKVVIADLEDNTFVLSLSNDVGIASNTTIEASGGRLEIRNGTVLGTNTADFKGSGRLVMTGGTYRIQTNYATVPLLSNYANYSLSEGIVEMNAIGNQTLSGAPSAYFNISVTGDNLFGTDSKKVTSNISISNNLSISGIAVFDSESNSVEGDAGLTMTGGRYRMAKLNETLPQLLGIATPYSLSAGIIELYGTSAVQTHSLRGTFNSGSNTVQYYNIELNSIAANVTAGNANVVTQASFGVQGVMNVNSPTCFKISSPYTIQDAGVSSVFDLKAGATLKYGSEISTSGNTGDIRTDIRNFPTTASYGFVGSLTPQTVGNGLPSSMVNMYLDKVSNQNVVLNQTTNVVAGLQLFNGRIDLNNYDLILGTCCSGASDAIIVGGSSLSYVIGWDGASNGNLIHHVNNTTGQYLFPIGDLTSYTPTEIKFNSGTSFLAGVPMLTTKVVKVSHPNKVNAIHYLNYYWNVEPVDFDSTNYNIWFDYDDIDIVGTESDMYPAKYNSLGWIFRDDAPASYVQGSGTSNFAINHINWNGLTKFSDFTMLGSGSPLPIELLDFKATAFSDYVQLNWTTASEINNQYFTVERSGVELKFNELLSLPGAVNSNQIRNYEAIDRNPLEGVSYYKLKQTDFDGEYSYSDIVAVNYVEREPRVTIYSTPDNQEINLLLYNLKGLVNVQLFDLTGKLIHSGSINIHEEICKQHIKLNSELAKGIYLIKVSNELTSISQKIRF